MSNMKIWIDWDDRGNAIERAESSVSSYFVPSRLLSIGRKDSKNVLVWDNATIGTKFIEELAGKKISCAYINIKTAMSKNGSDAGKMSALLEILIQIRSQMESDCIVMLRPEPELLDEMTVLLKNVFSETHYVSHASVLRGYDGFTELSVACPNDGQHNPHFFGWRRWYDMFNNCCSGNGLVLIAGFDEAVRGYLDYARMNEVKSEIALVSPLQRVISSCSNYVQQAGEAWNLLDETASHEASYFDGMNVYEIHPCWHTLLVHNKRQKEH